MTLSTLVLLIAAIALVLTAVVTVVYRAHKSWLLTFLQNFCGTLFIFSGAVKAIDPLGTAFKMEQYFAEFETTFAPTWFSFLAPMFPWLSKHAPTFSTTMITLEIVVGVMLLIGSRAKLTSWVFLIILAFFTFLTGFTYLTGYVPDKVMIAQKANEKDRDVLLEDFEALAAEGWAVKDTVDVHFFNFGYWHEYNETNMKVTDCGCFGDFLKLKPKTSFLKDIFLLIPALLFVFRHRRMHRLFSAAGRTTIVGLTTFGTILFCISNYVWNLPIIDFRPFKEGVNIAERKQQEAEAFQNAPIFYKLTNRSSKEVLRLSYEQYLKEFKNYPKEQWEIEQERGEPSIPRTKISDFEVQALDGSDATAQILGDPQYSFFITAYKIYGSQSKSTSMVPDTIFRMDTLRVGDSLAISRNVASISQRQIETTVYSWDTDYLKKWTNIVNPVMEAARQDGLNAYAVIAFDDPNRIEKLRSATQSNYSFFMADDILLKTIIRSNPGVTLMKNGKVIKHFHYKKLPPYEEIKAKYMK